MLKQIRIILLIALAFFGTALVLVGKFYPHVSIFPNFAVYCLYLRVTRGAQVVFHGAKLSLPMQWCISDREEKEVSLMNISHYFSFNPRLVSLRKFDDALYFFDRYAEISKNERCVSVRRYSVNSINVNELVSRCKGGPEAVWIMPEMGFFMSDCICAERDLKSDRELISGISRAKRKSVRDDEEGAGNTEKHGKPYGPYKNEGDLSRSIRYAQTMSRKICTRLCFPPSHAQQWGVMETNADKADGALVRKNKTARMAPEKDRTKHNTIRKNGA